MKLKYWATAAAVSASCLIGLAQATPVAVELALLVDVSGSVNGTEYTLQKQGYINAFNDATVQAQIAGLTGGIAVTYIEWSWATQQAQLVGWTHVFDAASASAFATSIANTTRADTGNTAPGSAINFAFPLFNTNGFDGLRQVIDVSGDGEQNEGDDTSDARDAALADGVDAINGLAIGNATLVNWYTNNIKGGTNSFVIQAATFQDFDAAVKSKIGREITGGNVPEPASLALVGLALAGLGFARRRQS